eukprot:gb/GECG01011598.1/.p1 GENE.gb/GECG01011598.1/~~gb/GECG01011598.1/.p1  ORF type:complete len:1059 (+),score=123.70 gb/GECG01011598.1/:1-3177(+)
MSLHRMMGQDNGPPNPLLGDDSDYTAEPSLPPLGTTVDIVGGDWKGMQGVVRHVGPVHFAKGDWVGLVLPVPKGIHDGTVQNVTYFSCKPRRGVFVGVNQVSQQGGAQEIEGSQTETSNVMVNGGSEVASPASAATQSQKHDAVEENSRFSDGEIHGHFDPPGRQQTPSSPARTNGPSREEESHQPVDTTIKVPSIEQPPWHATEHHPDGVEPVSSENAREERLPERNRGTNTGTPRPQLSQTDAHIVPTNPQVSTPKSSSAAGANRSMRSVRSSDTRKSSTKGKSPFVRARRYTSAAAWGESSVKWGKSSVTSHGSSRPRTPKSQRTSTSFAATERQPKRRPTRKTPSTPQRKSQRRAHSAPRSAVRERGRTTARLEKANPVRSPSAPAPKRSLYAVPPSKIKEMDSRFRESDDALIDLSHSLEPNWKLIQNKLKIGGTRSAANGGVSHRPAHQHSVRIREPLEEDARSKVDVPHSHTETTTQKPVGAGLALLGSAVPTATTKKSISTQTESRSVSQAEEEDWSSLLSTPVAPGLALLSSTTGAQSIHSAPSKRVWEAEGSQHPTLDTARGRAKLHQTIARARNLVREQVMVTMESRRESHSNTGTPSEHSGSPYPSVQGDSPQNLHDDHRQRRRLERWRKRRNMQTLPQSGSAMSPPASPSPAQTPSKQQQTNENRVLRKLVRSSINDALRSAISTYAMIRAHKEKHKQVASAHSVQASSWELSEYRGKYTVLSYGGMCEQGCPGPGEPSKPNQDSILMTEHWDSNVDAVLLGVFDGHGEYGHFISKRFVSDLPKLVFHSPHFSTDICKCLTESLLSIEHDLLHDQSIDPSLSGSTGVVSCIKDGVVYYANVGDSRFILLSRKENATKDPSSWLSLEQLTTDHKPTVTSELRRILLHGGNISALTYDDGSEGPPRVWVRDENIPGLAMTRSFGDTAGKRAGVISDAECGSFEISDHHFVLVVTSDGIHEFLENEEMRLIISECWYSTLAEYHEEVHEVDSKQWLAGLSEHDRESILGAFLQAVIDNLATVAAQKWLYEEGAIDDIGIVVAVVGQSS